MTTIRMKLVVSIYILTSLYIRQTITLDNCTYILPSEWSVPYCPEDIDRIEYEIKIDSLKLTGDDVNTVDQIDLFLKWIVDNFQDNKYEGEFRLKTSKIKKYYRLVTKLELKHHLLKYRRTFGSFENKDSYATSRIKHQNDLTLEVAISEPNLDFDYTQVMPSVNYSHEFEYKLEPNVFIDTCTPTNWSNYFYGSKATEYSAKLEFDDDEDIVPEDTDGPIIVNTTNWQNITNVDAFYCGDCSVNSCICCDIEEAFFIDYCQYFDYSLFSDFRYSSHVDYVVDITFYWYQGGYWDISDPTSKGKLTFQVEYEDENASKSDIPADSAEFSIKLYKEDTVDGAWQDLMEFAQELIEELVFPTDDIPPNEWLDYRDCEQLVMSTDDISTEYGTDDDIKRNTLLWIMIAAFPILAIILLFCMHWYGDSLKNTIDSFCFGDKRHNDVRLSNALESDPGALDVYLGEGNEGNLTIEGEKDAIMPAEKSGQTRNSLAAMVPKESYDA